MAPTSSPPPLHTLGEVAAKLKARDHVVRDAITTIKLQPAMKAGKYRLFDAAQIELVRKELQRRSARRGGVL